MNVTAAREIAQHVANLAEQVATFTALYGAHYRMSETSPAQAWELYRQIMAAQANIAGKLDMTALQAPYSRYGEWWKRHDVIDSAMVNELASEVFNLIGRCAYLTANGKCSFDSDLVLQRSIAGLLHPATRPVALESEAMTRKVM
ncbi:hypothetical protein HC776_02265 [bacterium]|nr:hypothetical protein [bacterium]